MAGRQRTRTASASSGGIREDEARLTVAVRVTPRARRNALTLEGETLRAWLTAPPVDGAANAALLALLAERLGLPKRAVTLLRGESSREKLVAIEGISAEEFRKRLAPSS
ncbi:MAG TPA: DUF167 family protein [Ktedonobacterales bacterium]|nr:DUF167 family protein [Ktedonobacterales bacterium]